MQMTRRVAFSAAHVELNEADSDAPQVFRGHNYLLDVTVSGRIDAASGIVVNIKDIDQIVRRTVLLELEGRCLNEAGGPMAGRIVTAETLLGRIKELVSPHLPPGVTLHRLRLEQTPLDVLEWSAEDDIETNGDVLVTRIYEFSASHRLHSDSLTEEENHALFGKCCNPNGHGHNYQLEICVAGPVDNRTARAIDPEALDEIVNREVVNRYDHRHLNLDIPEFQVLIPSSENVVRTIWFRLKDVIPHPARLYRVILRETARNFFEYSGED